MSPRKCEELRRKWSVHLVFSIGSNGPASMTQLPFVRVFPRQFPFPGDPAVAARALGSVMGIAVLKVWHLSRGRVGDLGSLKVALSDEPSLLNIRDPSWIRDFQDAANYVVETYAEIAARKPEELPLVAEFIDEFIDNDSLRDFAMRAVVLGEDFDLFDGIDD